MQDLQKFMNYPFPREKGKNPRKLKNSNYLRTLLIQGHNTVMNLIMIHTSVAFFVAG